VKLVVFGLSVTSAWGNGHATTYRALLRAFEARGHDIDFYEWDAPWYRLHRDMPHPAFCRLRLYQAWATSRDAALAAAREADAVLVGSYVQEGMRIVDDLADVCGDRLHFFDIDTPVTVGKLRRGECPFLRADQVPLFRRYLSFAGGPLLRGVLEAELGARDARPLYCCVDADLYRPAAPEARFSADLAYMGTYAADRQEGFERLLLTTARLQPQRTFLVAGPQYPDVPRWPSSVRHREHVAPHDHRAFYSSASWQLNLTRADMRRSGWAPSVRLFEAAACGAAILSDRWPGLESFFEAGSEILLPESAAEVAHVLDATHADDRRSMGEAARRRILAKHTSAHRARELEELLSPEPIEWRTARAVAGAAD
jgi:spore maturation protein CgeB